MTLPDDRTRSAAPQDDADRRDAGSHRWTFLSNHAHVLVCLARDPSTRLRDIAAGIGITERAVGGIVRDLETEGFLERRREGRRNSYVLRLDQPLRHPVERHREVGDLIELFLER